MSLAVATLVQRIRFELGDHPWEDPSCSAANATSTITGATDGDWAEGDIGEFVTDGDTFWVRSVVTTTLTATRSYNGSTGAAHTSERVFKNPRYGYQEIKNAISSVIQDRLWPKAWKKVADTITPDPTSTIWYDLAADARDLITVNQRHGLSDASLGFFGERHSAKTVVFARNLPSGIAASGVGVRFPGGFFHNSNTVNVDYAAKITDTISSTDYSDLTDGDAVVEAVIFGAVAQLETGLENKKPRKPRQDRETLRGAAIYERKFQDALNRAHLECKDTIPRMRKWSHG